MSLESLRKNNTVSVRRRIDLRPLNFSLLRPEELLFDQNRTFPTSPSPAGVVQKRRPTSMMFLEEKYARKNSSRQQQKMWCQMSVFARTHLVSSVSHGRLPRSSLVACQGCQLSLLYPSDWWSFSTFVL